MLTFTSGFMAIILSANLGRRISQHRMLQPLNPSYGHFLDLLTGLAGIWGIAAFIYSFWVFAWWLPFVALISGTFVSAYLMVRTRLMRVAPGAALVASIAGIVLTSLGLFSG